MRFNFGHAARRHQFVNQGNGLGVAFVGQPDAFQDDILGDCHGAGFHHHNGVPVAGDHHIEGGGAAAGEAGVDAVIVAVPGDPAGADGPVKGDLAEGQRRRGRHHAQSFRGVHFVHGEDGDDDLYFVVQSLGEQGADAAVGESGGEDGFGAGASFPPEKAAGDFAHRVEAFLKLHGQGQKVHIPGLFGHYGGSQQDGVPAGNGHGAVGLLRQASGFQGNGVAADFTRYGKGGHQCASGVSRISSGHTEVFSTSRVRGVLC